MEQRGESEQEIVDCLLPLVESLEFATVISVADEEALHERIAAMPKHIQQRVANSAVLQHARSDRVLDLLVTWLHAWDDLPLLRRVLLTLHIRATFDWVHRVPEENCQRLIARIEELASSPHWELSKEARQTLSTLYRLEQLPPNFDLAYLQLLGHRRQQVLEVIRLALSGCLMQPVAEGERPDSIPAPRLPSLDACYGRIPAAEARRRHEEFARRMDKAADKVADPKEQGRATHRMLLHAIREDQQGYSQWERILNQHWNAFGRADSIRDEQWHEIGRHVLIHLHDFFQLAIPPMLPPQYRPIVRYLSEILTSCAEARAACKQPPPFWEDVLNIIRAGGLPVGWHGRYPDWKFIVFWPEESSS